MSLMITWLKSNAGKAMRCHKVSWIIQYQVPNKILSLENFVHHVLLLFYLFRFFTIVFKQTVRARSPRYYKHEQKNLWTMGIYLIRFFCQFNEKPITDQDPHSQIKNCKLLGAQYPNEHDSEVKQTKHLQFSILCQKYYQTMKSMEV